jgi:hypothetical protein
MKSPSHAAPAFVRNDPVHIVSMVIATVSFPDSTKYPGPEAPPLVETVKKLDAHPAVPASPAHAAQKSVATFCCAVDGVAPASAVATHELLPPSVDVHDACCAHCDSAGSTDWLYTSLTDTQYDEKCSTVHAERSWLHVVQYAAAAEQSGLLPE